MVISLIEQIVDMLNSFPSKERIFTEMSSATLVEGKSKLDLSKKRDVHMEHMHKFGLEPRKI